jgi:hypothetical protein
MLFTDAIQAGNMTAQPPMVTANPGGTFTQSLLPQQGSTVHEPVAAFMSAAMLLSESCAADVADPCQDETAFRAIRVAPI